MYNYAMIPGYMNFLSPVELLLIENKPLKQKELVIYKNDNSELFHLFN